MEETSVSESRWLHKLLVFFGAVTGASVQLNLIASGENVGPITDAMVIFRMMIGANLFAVLFWILRSVMRWLVRFLPLSPAAWSHYLKYDTFTYGVFLLMLLGAVGIQLILPVVVFVLLLFLLLQGALLFLILSPLRKVRFTC